MSSCFEKMLLNDRPFSTVRRSEYLAICITWLSGSSGLPSGPPPATHRTPILRLFIRSSLPKYESGSGFRSAMAASIRPRSVSSTGMIGSSDHWSLRTWWWWEGIKTLWRPSSNQRLFQNFRRNLINFREFMNQALIENFHSCNPSTFGNAGGCHCLSSQLQSTYISKFA